MSYKGWYNMKDVRRDLVKVSGIPDFDENFVVVGAQPPPRLQVSDDDNETQMLRLYGGNQAPLDTDVVKPDLAGITHMLRMVEDYNETLPNIDVLECDKENKNDDDIDTILTITKLNPQVEEFVPLNKLSKENSLKSDTNNIRNKTTDKDSDKAIQLNNGEHTKESNMTEYCDDNSISNMSNAKINMSELKEDEIVEMRKQLKHTISDASKSKCIKSKRERNIAIATLLKLYSQPPKTSLEHNKPLKLITPNYFKTKLSDKEDILEHDSNIDRSLKLSKQGPNISNNISKEEEEQESLLSDKEVRASVDKVNNWLKNVACVNEPKKGSYAINKTNPVNSPITVSGDILTTEKNKSAPKPPTAFVGCVMFKRKEPKSPTKSSSLTTSDNSVPTIKEPLSVAFVPSNYANYLTKNYTERAKAKEEAASNIWTKLENELKAKDKVIKAKKEEETRLYESQ